MGNSEEAVEGRTGDPQLTGRLHPVATSLPQRLLDVLPRQAALPPGIERAALRRKQRLRQVLFPDDRT